MKWMEIAWAEVGVHAIPGPKAAPEVLGYFRDAGHREIDSDETAWCAAFVGACLERAGITCTRDLAARSYLNFGIGIETPRVGAIAVFDRLHDGVHGHVGFIAGWTETHILLLGGNQGHAVSQIQMPRTALIGLRWPGPAASPAELAAGGSRIAGAAMSQQRDAGLVLAANAAEQSLPARPPSLGLAEMVQQGSELQTLLETAERFMTFAWSKAGWIAAAATIYLAARMAWQAGLISWWRAEDHSTGKTTS